MKFRYGFVSNSSSSSFVIPMRVLSEKQVILIRSHSDSEDCYDGEAWHIKENNLTIEGSTIMDNFDMHHFLTVILGVDPKDIEWRSF